MKYKYLGKSGLKVSALSFGAWVTFGDQIGDATAERLMGTAYDAGVNFFDNAEVYANGKAELVMGKILKKMNWDRSTYCVSSKVFWGGELPNQMGLSRKHVIEGCHAALKRLQVAYLDLYFCHRPDINTPIEETVRAMTDLIQQGKILYWGTSEWSAAEIMEAYSVARAHHLVPPTMEQPEYNMLLQRKKIELDYLPLYKTVGLGTTIWSPLASGLLTGKYNNGMPKDTRASVKGMEWLKERFESEKTRRDIEKVKQLAELAKGLDMSLPQMAIAWCASNPNVSTVILGASKVEQLEHNLKTVDMIDRITPEVKKDIDEIVDNKPKHLVFT